MNKKIMLLVLMIALVFVAVGAVSAAANPGWVINMQLNTTLDLVCQGGYMVAIVDNNSQPTVARVTCYSFLPPGQSEQ